MSTIFCRLELVPVHMRWGHATIASTNDLSAAFWNPAALQGLETPFQIQAMHSEWFAGVTQYDYMGIGKPLNQERQAFGAISLIRLGIDNIPNTLEIIGPDGSIDYDNITRFSNSDYAAYVSYGQVLGNSGLAIGSSVKVIHRAIGRFAKSWGFGADLGLRFKKGNLMLAFMGKDITTTFNAWKYSFTEEEKQVLQSTGNVIPVRSTELTLPVFILGGAYQFSLGEDFTLLPEINLDINTDGQRNVLLSSGTINIDPHAGLEIGYKKYVFLRGGINRIQRGEDIAEPEKSILLYQPNIGLGLIFGRLGLDYALANLSDGSQFYYTHIFSLTLNLKERENK